MNNNALTTKLKPSNPLADLLANMRSAWMRGDLSQTDGAIIDEVFGQVHYENRVDGDNREHLYVDLTHDGVYHGGFRIYE